MYPLHVANSRPCFMLPKIFKMSKLMGKKCHLFNTNSDLICRCGGDGQMKCDPKPCSPEPMLRQMIAAAALRRRR